MFTQVFVSLSSTTVARRITSTHCCRWGPFSPYVVPCSCAADTRGNSPLPLLSRVYKRGNSTNDTSLHVPGHKKGNGILPAFKTVIGDALKYDLTELSDMDLLSNPIGPIAEAQVLAAHTWGAAATYWLVNGTSGGLHAALMATVNPGDTVLFARNIHSSTFHAAILVGCKPVYVQPCFSQDIAHQVTAVAVKRAFEDARPTPKALVLVSPTYFGVISDINAIAAICHEYNATLIVDEAHGAHLGLSPDFPPSALSCGADIVVQSTHKTLGAMTQGAMLHIKDQNSVYVDRTRIQRALAVLQTSSPSFLIMASLDAARAAVEDSLSFEECIRAANMSRTELQRLFSSTPLYTVLDAQDPLRLTVMPHYTTGYSVARELENEYGIISELCGPTFVVFAFGIGSTAQDGHALITAFKKLTVNYKNAECLNEVTDSNSFQIPEAVLTPREAFFAADIGTVEFSHAVGEISAELVCPYPPGIPLLFPGERISERALLQLQAVVQNGGWISGTSDPKLETIKIIRT